MPEPPQEAGKRKNGETSDAPLAKRPRTTLRKVPSLRVDRNKSEHTMPRIPPLSRQQSLYMVEGFRKWTYGVQSITTVVTLNLQRTSHVQFRILKNFHAIFQIGCPIS